MEFRIFAIIGVRAIAAMLIQSSEANAAGGEIANGLMRLGQSLQKMGQQQASRAAEERRAQAAAAATERQAQPAVAAARERAAQGIGLQTGAFPGRPALEAMPCEQRLDALLAFWSAEERKPKSTCDRAREKVAAQRDINDTFVACPGHLTTEPSILGEYEETQRQACSTPQLPRVPEQARTGGCPQSITVGGRSVSVIESINAHRGARRALEIAREQLGAVVSQGSCSNMLNREECEFQKESWAEMVGALQCHAALTSR